MPSVASFIKARRIVVRLTGHLRMHQLGVIRLPVRLPIKYGLGGGDGRLGGPDDGIAATFGQDIPRFAKVHLVGVVGGDPGG